MGKLNILILEDVEDDAKLSERALRDDGMEFSARRVETRDQFLRALEELPPDVILADCKLPHFDGSEALKLATKQLPGVPVIMVTGTLIDQDAVELLRMGASDYILKDRLSRLAPAVRRALSDAERARERAAAEQASRGSEIRYRRLFESTLDGILILDGETGAIVDANPYFARLLGYPLEDLIGKRVSDIGAVKDFAAAQAAFAELQSKDYIRYEHLPLSSKTGAVIDVEVISNAYQVEGRRFIQCNVRDIRERVQADGVLHERLDELQRFQRVTVDREVRLQELEERLAKLNGKSAKAA